MKLAACIVNYKSGAFALTCARSLLAEWERGGGRRGELELVVVDNASPVPQEVWLARLEALGARVVRSGQNLGYAGGIALGLSRARPAEQVLVLNPDLVLLPGSLAALLAAAAERPEAGALAPLAFVDPGCTLALPPVPELTPLEHWRSALAEIAPGLARRAADARTRAALRWWGARAPFEATNLSGACLLVPRASLAALDGTLLDPRYPLYFEDSDLCRRLRAAGRPLLVVPAARVAHHWARSSGVGADFEGDPRERYLASRRAWFERWYPGLAGRFAAAAEGLLESWPQRERGRAIHPLVDLGQLDRSPELRLRRDARWVLELAMTPTFALAGGVLGAGPRARLAPACFEWLFPGRVFVRALDRESLACLGAWTFVKTSAARSRPVELWAEAKA